MNWGHPRKNPSKKFGCDTSYKFVARLGKDLQYSPSLVPSCTRSRSNFSDEVFFLGCRNLWMVCVKIRRCIKGEESPWLQPNVIPAKAGISLRLPRTPTAGAQTPPRNARAINSILSFSEPLNSSVSSRACCRRKSFRILRKDCFQVSGSKVPSCK